MGVALSPCIHIGPLTLGSYGLMVATGLICAFFILRADFARRGVSADAEAIIGITGLAGLAGSRLYHLLESPAEFFADPWPQLFSTMGFAFFAPTIAALAPNLLWGMAFNPLPPGSRILRFIQVDHGALDPSYGRDVRGLPLDAIVRVHPTPIYEFLVAILIFWILWRLGGRGLKSHAPDG